jgi:hypothetical protein
VVPLVLNSNVRNEFMESVLYKWSLPSNTWLLGYSLDNQGLIPGRGRGFFLVIT